jgi:photosystem II stability/assembly factor-like uncharacterized protein
VASLAALLLAGGQLGGAIARPPTQPSWEPTGLGVATTRLFAPASGALFAQAAAPDGLQRSNDGGMTWAPVAVPAGTRTAVVDPADHTRLYAITDDGVYRSRDDAASWRAIRPAGEPIHTLVVSPADSNLLYLVETLASQPTGGLRFSRSRDGGDTWTTLETMQLGPNYDRLCVWWLGLLVAHPTDPRRVFRAAGCSIGGASYRSFVVAQSTDQGSTWSTFFDPMCCGPSKGLLVGGYPAEPARLYVAGNVGGPPGNTHLFASADDGRTWNDVTGSERLRIGALAVDVAAPDHVYVGLERDPQYLPLAPGGVRASRDSGQTWTALGLDGGPRIHDLAVGVDSANLYTATDRGVWRLRLSPP